MLRVFTVLFLTLSLGACGLIPESTDLANKPESELTADELYYLASESARQGNYTGAVERLENLQARYPFDPKTKQAQLDIIYYYFKADEKDSTIAAADRFLRLNPTHPRADYALYMRGTANFETGQHFVNELLPRDRSKRDPRSLRTAFQDFERLIRDHPASEYAEDARHHMRVIKNMLAQHELHVARYYMEYEAYTAAANRAQGVVDRFQGTPAVREALGILVEAYGKLGLDELKADALRVIRLNYPDHPALSKG